MERHDDRALLARSDGHGHDAHVSFEAHEPLPFDGRKRRARRRRELVTPSLRDRSVGALGRWWCGRAPCDAQSQPEARGPRDETRSEARGVLHTRPSPRGTRRDRNFECEKE